MWHLKLFAVLVICLLLAVQVHGSPIPELSSAKKRPRRMTPFWRAVSLRPIGASCRDDSECLTRLCRCSVSVFEYFRAVSFFSLKSLRYSRDWHRRLSNGKGQRVYQVSRLWL
uniref:Liver-expressed antimicrobial peptide 2 n=2 Tax=Sus scrofa TaxID=9823 RepID=A0A8D1XYR8_PIG